MKQLIHDIQKGDHRAIARAISFLELQDDKSRALLDMIPLSLDKAPVIGITGPPGSGKSTLVNQLILYYREKGERTAVIAVDPTSPFTGGAILGDRIRMLEFSQDPLVFIRSLASKGALGGLAPAVFDCVHLLQFAGFERILIETIGIGQSEVDIAQNCDTTVVLAVPGLGDDVQTLKAGIMEIADIFVVNKADRSGVDTLYLQIKQALNHQNEEEAWKPKITKTIATTGEGVNELCTLIEDHFTYLKDNQLLLNLRKTQLRERLLSIIRQEITRDLSTKYASYLDQTLKQLISSEWSISKAISYLKAKLDI